MWVARDKDGGLAVYREKPIRDARNWSCDRKVSCEWRPLWFGFDDLKWEDEPLEIDDMYLGLLLW